MQHCAHTAQHVQPIGTDSPLRVPPGHAGDPGSERGPAKALGLTMPGTAGTAGTVAIGAWIIPGPGAGNAPGDPTGRP